MYKTRWQDIWNPQALMGIWFEFNTTLFSSIWSWIGWKSIFLYKTLDIARWKNIFPHPILCIKIKLFNETQIGGRWWSEVVRAPIVDAAELHGTFWHSSTIVRLILSLWYRTLGEQLLAYVVFTKVCCGWQRSLTVNLLWQRAWSWQNVVFQVQFHRLNRGEIHSHTAGQLHGVGVGDLPIRNAKHRIAAGRGRRGKSLSWTIWAHGLGWI